MKKKLLIVFLVLFVSGLSIAQPLRGIKSIPGDYATVESAIQALNTQGADSVLIFNVAAGHTETFSAPTAGNITTLTGSITTPITFQKSGAGNNPLITAATGTGTTDAIIAIGGCDYVTFDGIDLQEKSSNTTTAQQMEWGYAILKASTSNGSQYITIRNCSIKLAKTNTASVGIYANNHIIGATSQLTLVAPSGTNSNLKIYSNSINSCYIGISVSGYNHTSAPYDLFDQNNEIGKDGGNTITNFGGSTVAMNGILTIYQNNLKVANNNITGDVSGTGQCAGIQLGSSANASVEIYNNYVSLQFTGTGAFYGIYDNMGTTNTTTNSVSVYNNTVTGCTMPNATTANCYYINISHGGPTYSFHHNTVSNNTYGSSSFSATGNWYCIFLGANPTTSGTADVYNNIINNNARVQSTIGGGINYLLYQNAKGITSNTYDNTITNNTFASNGGGYGIYLLNGSTTKNCYNNTLRGIYNSNGNTYCIYNGNGTYVNINNNIFQDVTVSSAGSTLYGIHHSSLTSSGTCFIYNNFVSELKAPIATSASAPSIIALSLPGNSSTSTMGVYNNTVYLNATSTGANFSTTGVMLHANVALNDLRNNIIINLSTPTGTGITSAMRNNTTSLANYAPACNNNNFYAGTPTNNRVIYYDGLYYDKTLQEYKARVQPRDNNSVTENTAFVNTSTAPFDLHVNAAVPAQVEGSGTIVATPAITTDFDNEPRYPNTGYPVNGSYPPIAPDMGADEFGGIPNDVTPPSIIYTPFTFTAHTGARTLTATITDFSGVPTSGIGLPRLCWKINTPGTWTYVTGSSIGSNQYDFNFGSGTATGDTVYYFIVAQDQYTTPAVGSYPFINAGGFSANPPTCTIPPSNPSYFYFSDSLCGTYTVGVGGNFPTLTAAIQAYNTREITCPVFFDLTDATYPSETIPIDIKKNPGSSSAAILTIRPSNGNVLSIGGNSTDAIIKLNGAQYVTFDGSKSGATDRSMTVFNQVTASALSTVFKLTNDGTYPASNITIKNCNIQSTNTTIYASYCISMDNAVGTGGYSNIIIDNNLITSCKFGVGIFGSAANNASNIQLTNNSIGTNLDATGIIKRGVEVQYANNVLIQGNEIQGQPGGNNAPQTTAGIFVTAGTNVRILKNIVHDWYTSATGIGYNATGIYYGPESSAVGEISNNVVYNIKYPGSSTNPSGANATGIATANQVNNLKVYNNTVYIAGNFLLGTTATSSTCLYFGNNNTNIDARNNILKNSSQPTSGTPASNTYAIYLGTGFAGTLDKNCYFVDGIGPMIGYTSNTPYSTLAAWQTATGKDANSVNIDPQFVSSTNLHQTNAAIAKLGDYISTVPTDIEGKNRTNPADMGAYQVSADPSVITDVASYAGSDVILNGSINAQGATVIAGFEYGTTLSYGNFVAATPGTITGSSPTAISATLTGISPNVNYYYRAVGTSGSSTIYGGSQGFIILTQGNVTFNVDMSTAAGFTPGTDVVYLAGNFPGATWNEPGSNPSLQMTQVGSTLTYTLTLNNLPYGSYEYKYFRNAGWGGGEWAGGSNRIVVVATATQQVNDTWGGQINWANLQWPGSGAINTGDAYNVYAQAYIANGITGGAGATYGLQAWIGYSTSDTDPSTWTNWVPASFNTQSGENDEFMADLGAAITSAGTYYYASRYQFGNMPYVYGGFSGGFWDGITNVSGVLTVTEAYKTLNLALLLEGLYAGNGLMNKAQNENGDQYPGNVADQIMVELHDATNYALIVYSASNVDLSTLGVSSVSNIPAVHNGSYFVTIRHRNSIETTSALPVSFAGGTITYDFDVASKAYGSNMTVAGEEALIYGGDVNQDGLVDSSDMIDVDNDVASFVAGYVDTDVNGDGLVDSSDMILIDNNSSAFVAAVLP